jgi:hypothetical protein
VDYRDDLLNLRTAFSVKLPYLIGGGANQAATVKKQKNKTLLTSQLPG